MALKLLFFAQCAHWVKRREMLLTIANPSNLLTIIENTPELKPILEQRRFLQVAINQEFSRFNTEVKEGDEIAFLPPVSGG